eukprot:CAMPEP_0197196074 /NCGR_PEP_ID=MMETSP1423-20130617/32159_1 /TAXON_ID=476441 /ORGANISM="Pseudo-nitzschia heimii, Strain UNC1101" /LENGTH=344 /DNA_ID=CAMNT_0042649843 /DNA_START=244 /DNA_END=1278 /DNA_ORIENTATION=-
MPDVTTMNAAEMRLELESYGINTQTLLEKREFEQTLIEARRQYEQTLNDVMSTTRPKEKKVQTRRRTVNYDRREHRHERIYSSDVNDQPGGQHYHDQEQFFRRRQYQAQPNPVGNFSREHRHERIYSSDVNDQPGGQHYHDQEQFFRQQKQQPPRRRRQYQAQPNPVGNFNTYPNVNNNGPQDMGRSNNAWFEEDPLFEHEKQAQQFRPNGDQHHYHHDPQVHFEEQYEVGSRQRRPQARAIYNDPEMEMKYQTALQESYTMKVEDLQRELNCRGISTKNCMIFKDFCIEYAKAIAENRAKVAEQPSSSSDDDNASAFGDDNDDDYDPTYKDVVMQKYDPSMWV